LPSVLVRIDWKVQPNNPPRFEPIDRQQIVLEPLDIEQLIPEDHAARSIWEILGRLDLSGFIGDVKSLEGHAGRNIWEPRLLAALWIYAYSRGISSAREIERQSAYEPALRWLTGLKVVNYHTLSDFRVEHGAALQNLFVQVLGLLAMEKLITLERVMVDGTKVRACVNKKTFSRAHKIREHLKLTREHVETLQAEEAEQGKRTRQASARRRAARERLERLEAASAEVERLQAEKKWEREKPCQASTTDADAQFMRTSDHGLAPSYNVQLTTDAEHKLIVDVEVSKQPSDSLHLLPALERVQERLGVFPREAVADGDYTTREAVVGAVERGVDYYGSWNEIREERMGHGIDPAYHPSAFRYDQRHDEMICPEGRRLELRHTQQKSGGLQVLVYAAGRDDCRRCSKRRWCTPQNAMQKHGRTVSVRMEPKALTRYHAKMRTDRAKALYKQRAPVAEFPNAWLKDKLKWVRLRCRGVVKAKAEALWACLTYNLQRYFKLRQPQPA
jgi:transposase